MKVLVSYDISDDKRRRKVCKAIEGYGYRVQYSVFECDLSRKQMSELKKKIQPHVKGREMDSVRFYPLHEDSAKAILVMGNDMARSLGVVTVI